MKVEIWSDFVCPFCYIGKRRFEQALAKFPHKNHVEVIYRSFELDPHAARDSKHDTHEMLAAKYGMSYEQAQAMTNNVAQQAAGVGLTFHFNTAIQTNTFDAHRLMYFAASHGKMHTMTERLLQAHFTDSEHIGNHKILVALAKEIGLDPNETANMLAGEEYAEEVRKDEQEARTIGVQGVPFFVINRKYAISGAQPSEVFLSALEKAWSEEQPLTILHDSAGDGCTDVACSPNSKNEAK